MFELPKVFHVSHVVDDLDQAVAWYADVFSPRVWQQSELWGTALALLVVGDVALMPMAPGPGSAPERFRQRFGDRLHSLAVYVEEPDDLIAHLRGQGLRLTGSRGQPLDDPRDEIWTQPRESPMVFEFFEPRESMADPRLEEGWSSSYWRTEHPMGIIGAHYTVVSGDGPAATRFLVDALRGSVIYETAVPYYGTRSSFVALSDEVVIEVAEPDGSGQAAGEDLARGGAFHAVTFRVADLERAVSHVESKGIRVDRPAEGHAALDPRDTLGMLLRLTERDIAEW